MSLIEIEREGTKITLPKRMTLETAVKELQQKIADDETEVAIYEEIDAWPLDGAYAFHKILEKRYGWARGEAKKSFFGSQPPASVSVEIAKGKFESLLWGLLKVGEIAGYLETGTQGKEGRVIFIIGGVCKKKHREEVAEMAQEVRKYVKEHSIYQGQAIRIHQDNKGGIQWASAPSFLDIDAIREEELTFTEDLQEQVQTNLFTPVEKTKECREQEIPLKRGVLMAGAYGTGKTLTAYVMAKKCTQNGWTFIYLPNVEGLAQALDLARMYAPATIFAEDIDAVASGERGTSMNDILNTIDGIEGKATEVMVMLSTNFPEKIEKALLRPGRLDAVLHFTPPDAKAAQKLLSIYSRGRLAEGESLVSPANILAGEIPAVIREVVERAKLYAISRGESKLRESDIEKSAQGMKSHLILLRGEQNLKSKGEVLRDSFEDIVRSAFNGSSEKIEEIHKRVHGR